MTDYDSCMTDGLVAVAVLIVEGFRDSVRGVEGLILLSVFCIRGQSM